MTALLDWRVVWTLAKRTFRHSVESPIAYVVALFFYGVVGTLFGLGFFTSSQASIGGVGEVAPWILWFVVPALTMGLVSDELRTGTFEQLSTLPVRDWEIVAGKYLGFALIGGSLIAGLGVYPVIVALIAQGPAGLDWGSAIGTLAGLLAMTLTYGAMGLFASTLAKNQVVALIIGMIFCTFFFFVGMFYALLPGLLANLADALGVMSHMTTLSRGVWDVRDLLYFGSVIFLFLYLSVQRLTTRRF